ncbi:hypothetical protein OGV25_09450 [Pseudomonas sp. P1B16]|uniref:hypothetical protein n=1 Tax=Pseudomonas sp. P1B16 TaxID=2986074 RepID=UPI002A245BCE|nr:hypothetical protein [Pseudomonas sp. P1B16]WPM29281.1 hypothetical protein OGV25_09450 [Pseudomonas sp. P1B16]
MINKEEGDLGCMNIACWATASAGTIVSIKNDRNEKQAQRVSLGIDYKIGFKSDFLDRSP